jgi:geranylgeranyl diphosphate synthase type I
MTFQQCLGGLKVAINRELEHYFDIAIADAKKEDRLIAEALMQTKKITLAGGKRIRGTLLCQAYFSVGGKEKKKILKVAAAIELVHMFLLIHDDIMDRGNLRHGQETVHKLFADKKRKNIFASEADHFGNSVAIITGELLYVMANKIIADAGFDYKATVAVLAKLQSIVGTTIFGQSQDIGIAYNKNVTEKEVLAMYKNKTARYTFEGPLHMGAILTGTSDKKTLGIFSRYALPLGIAFQIQDDILGVFGSTKKIGKSTFSDIEEGKKSLIVVKAFKFASIFQRKQLKSILGKKNLTQKEIKIFQNIIMSTGALNYAKGLASKQFTQGKKEIEKAVLFPKEKKFFIELVEYLEKRET